MKSWNFHKKRVLFLNFQGLIYIYYNPAARPGPEDRVRRVRPTHTLRGAGGGLYELIPSHGGGGGVSETGCTTTFGAV